MKKLMSVILAVALMIGSLCIGAGAEANVEETILAIDYVLDDYLFFAELCNGYFAKGASPTAFAIDQYFKWDVAFMGDEVDEYVFEMDEYGFGTYHVPADVYESHVFDVFGNEEAVREVLHSADFYKTDYYEIAVGGGFGDYLPSIVTQGYVENDDGTITAYAYLVDTIDTDNDWTEYVPSDDEVEGEDYVYILTDEYEYAEETEEIAYGVKFVPAKISAGLRSVMTLDVEMWTATYYSYEYIEASEVPAAEDMNVFESDSTIVYMGGAFIELNREILDDGKTLFSTEYLNDEAGGAVFAETAELLKEYGELAVVGDFAVKKNGEITTPNGEIALSFWMPNEISPDATVYYIAEDGTVTELATAVDPDSYDDYILYATANMERSGRYAVAGTLYGDSDENGKVNLSDVSAMLKKIAKWDVSMNDVAIDVNRDGKINLSDVSMVLKYIAKWDVVFG